MPQHGLFGESISISLPEQFFDVSSLRQVPDNQEVFVSRDSDASIIIELLETPEEAALSDAFVKFHWNNLVDDNEALSSIIDFTSPTNTIELSEGHSGTCQFLHGTQKIEKFGKSDQLVDVKMFLYLLRIPSVSTDILLSMNAPEGTTVQEFEAICKSLNVINWTLFA